MQDLGSFPSTSYNEEQHQAFQAFEQSEDLMIQHSVALSHYIVRLTILSCIASPFGII